MDVPQKTKNKIPDDLAILLLGIYPKKMKTLILKDICMLMLIATLFTTAKIGKQPKCPSREERIKKMSHTHTHTYTHTEEYYSVIKRMKECHLQKMYRYRYLEGMMCVISQTEKHKHPVITYM